MTKSLTILVFCFLNLTTTPVHRDRQIKLEADGKLVGLPKEYSPAYFDKDNFTLKIGNSKVEIPCCIKEIFGDCSEYNISFASSWYHDTELLPPYIHMDILSTREYQIYFDLNTLEVFDIWQPEIVIKEDGGSQFYTNSQKLSEECDQAVKNAITKI